LSKDESDRAVRVARVTAMAEQAFGEQGSAWRWLRKPKRPFNGKTPIEMLATEAGARLVEEMVAQIEDGIAV
jgi:putative toxin-antitoxin system antitoxin component (TIGR02293 family)